MRRAWPRPSAAAQDAGHADLVMLALSNIHALTWVYRECSHGPLPPKHLASAKNCRDTFSPCLRASVVDLLFPDLRLADYPISNQVVECAGEFTAAISAGHCALSRSAFAFAYL